MAGRIPQSFIDDVLDRVDIVDIVGSRIDLRKSGKNHSACCPFHDEKTPSFTVSQDKQFFYCFGCGAGGNAIGFVIDFDRVSFPEAVEILAKHVGLEVPRETGQNDIASQYRKSLYAITEKADNYYRSSLRHHPNAGEAVRYLKSRKLTGDTAKNFGIGYAPPGWDNLLQNLGKTDEDIRLLKASGLLIDREEDNKLYDRFRHRIMFPIRDVRGRTIGFGGRVLGDDKPKYLNSPETPLFHKSRELYGLYEANQKLRDIPNLLVVEGYMDVAALSQHGIHNAVATLGTAATAEHLDKLFRYTSEVVFCFDGDEAGRKAARRALETSLPVMLDGRSAKFLFLPEGEDPDSLVQQIGCDQFLTLIKTATPISDFLFESLSQDIDTNAMDGKARLSKLAAPLINRMPQGVFKTLMLKTLSQQTGLDTDTLSGLIEPEAPPEWADGQTFPAEYEQAAYAGNDHHDYDGEVKPDYSHHGQAPLQREAFSRYQKRVKMPPVQTLIALLANHPELVRFAPDLDTLKDIFSDGLDSDSSASENKASENRTANSSFSDNGFSGNGFSGNDRPDNKPIEGLDILIPLVELIRENPGYTLNHILGYWRGVHDLQQAEQLTEIAATDLLRPVGDSSRDNEREFQDILGKLLRQSTTNLPPLEFFHHLANKDTIDEQDLKALNRAWLELPDSLRNEETKALFNQIVKKPRCH